LFIFNEELFLICVTHIYFFFFIIFIYFYPFSVPLPTLLMKDVNVIPFPFLPNADLCYVLFLQALQIFVSFLLLNNSLPFFSIHSHLTPVLNLRLSQNSYDSVPPS